RPLRAPLHLHDALPIWRRRARAVRRPLGTRGGVMDMAQTTPSKWRKVAISTAVGAVLGVLGMVALAPLLESGLLGSAGNSELLEIGKHTSELQSRENLV